MFTYRSERYPQANLNTAAPLNTWVLTSRSDPGPDGLAGTTDDSTYSYYDRTLSGTRTLITNDPTQKQTYKGLEITATKRMSNRWQMLAGYTYSQTTLSDISVANSPNAFLNTEGVVYNDRPHQFKLTGSFIFPYDIYVGMNYRLQNGPPINRTISAPLSFGGGSATINIEKPGAHRLDSLQTVALRLAKTLRMGGNRSLEVDLDIDNLTNANTAWELRALTGRISLRQAGDPAGALNNVQQFLSPSQILAPRIIRFGIAYRF